MAEAGVHRHLIVCLGNTFSFICYNISFYFQVNIQYMFAFSSQMVSCGLINQIKVMVFLTKVQNTRVQVRLSCISNIVLKLQI